MRKQASLAAIGGVALGVALAPAAAWGQEAEQEDDAGIIVTASRAAQAVRNIPSNVEVITQDAIEGTPAMHIGQMLKKNASVDVIEYPGGQSGIGLRGFRPEFSGVNQRVLTLVNGRPAGATSIGNVASAGLSRIEVLKGSASAIYGPSAMGGVVNFITRESRGDLGGRMTLGYGTYDTVHLEANVGGSLSDNFDFDLGARHYRQHDDYRLGSGGRDYGAFVQGHGAVRPNTAFEQNSFYARAAVQLADGWRLQGRLLAFDAPRTETPGQESDSINNQSDRTESNIGGDIALYAAVGNHDLTALYYHVVEENTVTQKPVSAPAYLSSDRNTRFQGVQLQDNWAITDTIDLIVGGDWGLVRNEAGAYNTDGSRRGAFTPNFRRENYGVYADLTTRLWDERLVLNAGGRFDRIEAAVLATPMRNDLTPGSSTFNTFNPRAGIVLRPFADIPLRIHASAGTGFVVPEASDIAGLSEQVVSGQTRVSRGNPDLGPEKSESYDIGIGYEAGFFGVDVTYFRLDVKDRISSVITINTPTYRETTFENAFGSRSEGIEATLQLDPLAPFIGRRSPLEIDASLTHFLKREEELSTGLSTVRNVAKTKVNFGVAYDDGTFRLRFAGRYVEGMMDSDFSLGRYFTGGAGGLYEYDPFTVYDLSGSWKLTPEHMVAVKIDNVTDKYYYEKGDYPMSGRRAMVTYTYSF